MAHSNQAKKRVRQNLKTELHNRSIKSRLYHYIKLAYAAIDNNDEKKDDLIKTAQSNLDKAVNKNLIHKNKASRTKSRMLKYKKRTES
jgi:small subunit ribosomal protein S20